MIRARRPRSAAGLNLNQEIAHETQNRRSVDRISAAVRRGSARYSAQVTYHHYVAIDLGTLGGPNSAGCVPNCRFLNNQGAAIFNSDTAKPDPFGSNPNNVFNDGNLESGGVLAKWHFHPARLVTAWL